MMAKMLCYNPVLLQQQNLLHAIWMQPCSNLSVQPYTLFDFQK